MEKCEIQCGVQYSSGKFLDSLIWTENTGTLCGVTKIPRYSFETRLFHTMFVQEFLV